MVKEHLKMATFQSTITDIKNLSNELKNKILITGATGGIEIFSRKLN